MTHPMRDLATTAIRWSMLLATMAIAVWIGGCPSKPTTTNETATENKTPDANGQRESSTEIRRDQTPRRKCTHLCDCRQGEDCEKGFCIVSPGLIPVYCCSNADCAFGQKCFYRDGTEDKCKTGTPCEGILDCARPSCEAGNGTQCLQLGERCADGQCLTTRTPVANATCGADGNCKPTP